MKEWNNIIQNIRTNSDQSATLLFLLLICADSIFVVLGIAANITNIDPKFFLSAERGYAESFQYIKFFWIIILLVYILKSAKCVNYLSWIMVFTYFLLDDSMQIHEKFGTFLTNSFDFNPPFNLRLQDIGELLVTAISGMVLIIVLYWAYIHGSLSFRNRSKDIGLFVIGLVFFGVVLDLVNGAVQHGATDHAGVIEDGGEMLVTSLILWYAFNLAVHKGNSNLFLCDLIHKGKESSEHDLYRSKI